MGAGSFSDMSDIQGAEGAMVHHLEPHRLQLKPQSPSSSSKFASFFEI